MLVVTCVVWVYAFAGRHNVVNSRYAVAQAAEKVAAVWPFLPWLLTIPTTVVLGLNLERPEGDCTVLLWMYSHSCTMSCNHAELEHVGVCARCGQMITCVDANI